MRNPSACGSSLWSMPIPSPWLGVTKAKLALLTAIPRSRLNWQLPRVKAGRHCNSRATPKSPNSTTKNVEVEQPVQTVYA
jgi:hypothetical protein